MSNQPQSKPHKFEQHQKLKNSNKKAEILRKMMSDPLPNNQEWKISYYPLKTELLCETCGQTFTYTSAFHRHMKIQHKPRNLRRPDPISCHKWDVSYFMTLKKKITNFYVAYAAI